MARPARPGAHQALLEAACAEFALRGLERARVEDIARRAGISKGAFYLHFRTKEAAFDELLHRLLGALEALAQRRAAATTRLDAAPPARRPTATAASRWSRIERSLDTELLELLWANRQLVRALDGAGGNRRSSPVELLRDRVRALALGRVAARRAAGLLRPGLDAEVVADLVTGGYEGCARRMAGLHARPDLGAWAGSFLKVLDRGLLAPLARPPRRRPARRRPSY
jgi:AcrR family transcriptional regulator